MIQLVFRFVFYNNNLFCINLQAQLSSTQRHTLETYIRERQERRVQKLRDDIDTALRERESHVCYCFF
jgi:hypothetical protein